MIYSKTVLVHNVFVMLLALFISGVSLASEDALPVLQIYITEIHNETDVELIRDFVDATGLEYELIGSPWIRSVRAARNNDNVILAYLDRTEEREPDYHWILPLRIKTEYLFMKSDTVFQNETLASLASSGGIAICILGSAQCQHFMALGISEENLIRLPTDNGEMSTMLIRGRADFMISSIESIKTKVSELVITGNELIPKFKMFDTTTYLAAPSHLNTELLRRLMHSVEK